MCSNSVDEYIIIVKEMFKKLTLLLLLSALTLSQNLLAEQGAKVGGY